MRALSHLAVGTGCFFLSLSLLTALLWFAAGHIAQERVALAARAAADQAENIIDRVLMQIGPIPAGPEVYCTDSLQSYLASVEDYSYLIRGLGVGDGSGRIRCSSGGPLSYELPAARTQAEFRGGVRLELAARRTPLRSGLSVVLVLHKRAGTVTAAVHPESFLHNKDYISPRYPALVAISLSTGEQIVSAIDRRTEADPGAISHTAEAKRYPVVARAVVPRQARQDMFWRYLKWSAPLFIGLSVVLAVLGKRALSRPSSRRELEAALRRGEFVPYYQPLVDLETRRCVGVEVLVRWLHPERGPIAPDIFIRAVEDLGLVVPLTERLFDRALRELGPVLKARPDFQVALNLAADHFSTAEPTCALMKMAEDAGFGGDRFIFEATERQLLPDEASARTIMQDLQSRGVVIALDDFGTGQNGLAYLQRFPAQKIKVDRMFVDTIGTDSVSRPVLDALIGLGHRLSLLIIAEGIEREEQVAFLRDRNVPYGQGYLFSRPVPIDRLSDYLAREEAPESRREIQSSLAAEHVQV